jgi:hypothetical protein
VDIQRHPPTPFKQFGGTWVFINHIASWEASNNAFGSGIKPRIYLDMTGRNLWDSERQAIDTVGARGAKIVNQVLDRSSVRVAVVGGCVPSAFRTHRRLGRSPANTKRGRLGYGLLDAGLPAHLQTG